MTAFHLDAGYKPLFPFGHGLSYAEFELSRHSTTSTTEIRPGDTVGISAELTNRGDVAGGKWLSCMCATWSAT